MTRVEMVRRLLGEGLSRNTLVNLTDKQLNSLCERMLNEGVTKVATADTKTQDELKQQKKPFELYEKKKPTTKQLSALDKNKNGKIDKEDFKLLRSKKNSSKEEVKKGSLKKSSGLKKDEKTTESKIKSTPKKSNKVGQKLKLAPKLKENIEIKNWVEDIVENNYHPFTSKNEIMELIKTKLNEVETSSIPMPATKAKKGHNGVPEFMTYDAIMGSSETKEKPAPTETPVRERPKTTPGEKPKKPSYIPGPGPDHKPKAGLSEKKNLKNGNK
jgi:hypothetical protein